MEISGTEAWGETHEIVSAPDVPGTLISHFVGFVLNGEDAELIVASPELKKSVDAIRKALEAYHSQMKSKGLHRAPRLAMQFAEAVETILYEGRGSK